MYVPRPNVIDDHDELRRLVAAVGAAELVTAAPAAGPGAEEPFPLATRLPVLWRGDRLLMHMALANPHWRALAGRTTPALAVVTGPEAYVSPAWYPSKAEHGRVVPTWNYSAVHLRGHLRVHTDPEWLLAQVGELSDAFEGARATPGGTGRRVDAWRVGDAPEEFIAQQLRAIVGLELEVVDVQGKAKLSQNRSEADRSGVVVGLRAEGAGREHAVADEMAAQLGAPAGEPRTEGTVGSDGRRAGR